MTLLDPPNAPTAADRARRIVRERRRQWRSAISIGVDEVELERLIACEVWAAERRLLGRLIELKKGRRRRRFDVA